MAPPVITITRQYASGGSEVARLVAVGLDWTVIDNEFVDQVAQRAGLPAEEVAQREERAPGLLERLARTLAVASPEMLDRKSTRLNSSHTVISYAVFCLKKKKKNDRNQRLRE